LAIAIVLQLTLACYLHSSVVTVASTALSLECGVTSAWLRNVALFAFNTFVVGDVLETFGMHQWINEFSTAPQHEMLTVQQFKDTGAATRNGRYPLILRPVSGITHAERGCFYALCLVPKLIVAVACQLAGTGAILRVTNDFDLVLAAVAAVFILELDDGLFKVLAGDVVKNAAGNAPALGVPEKEVSKLEFWWSVFQGVLVPLLIVFLGSLAEHLYWCAGASGGVASDSALATILGVAGAFGLAFVCCVFSNLRKGASGSLLMS